MSKEAMKLALEALESCGAAHITDGGRQWYDEKLVDTAYAALQEALAQQALDKKAENARELGLDYEPVCNKDPQGCWNVRCQLGKKCKNTPAQQEPVAWYDSKTGWTDFHSFKPTRKPSAPDAEWLPLYTSPPAQRTWVGLTGFEQKELMAMSAREAVFATEAKLKEKNT